MLLSPTPTAASTSLTSHLTRPSSSSSKARLSPSVLHAYCARVLACLLLACLSVCGSTVRFTSSSCLLLAVCCCHHRAAHPSSTSPLPLRHAAPRAPPDLLLRRRRQQRGRLSSAQPGWQPLPQEMPRRESHCLVIPLLSPIRMHSCLSACCPPCYCPMLSLFAVIFSIDSSSHTLSSYIIRETS